MPRINNRRGLALILVAALILRLAVGLSESASLDILNTGGDSQFYLQVGYNLISGYDYSQISIPTAPLYLVFVGLWQALPLPAAIVGIRVTQALMGVATCYFAYRMAWTVSRDESAGLATAFALAISPAFVIESRQILTETLYIFLVSAALWAYIKSFVIETAGTRTIVSLHIALAAALLGLATLTRAVLLVFPLGLAVHLLLVCGWRRGLKRAALLLVVYALVISTWTIYNRVAWGRWVIAAPGFSSFIYLGAAGWDSPEQVDRNLAEHAGVTGALPSNPDEQQKLYADAASSLILSDVGGYLRRRVSDLAEAYVQPHGTIYFRGDSLKDMAANWLQHDRTPGGLLWLTQSDRFWPKLVIYIFHYAGLILGIVGLWLMRRQWRLALPLIGFIVYTTLVHFVLDALPRYLFPTMIIWWVFAGITISRWWFARAAAGR